LGAVLALRGEDRVEEAREAVVQIVLAEAQQTAAAVGAGAYHAALAQHSEVVREGRFGEAELEGAAGALVAVRELADDLESRRITQRVQYGRELQLLTGWVMWLSHAELLGLL